MRLDETFMHNVLSLYDELIENGVYIVYIGKFTQKITKFFSSLLEEELEQQDDRKTKRRIFHTIVEILQNMQRHTEEFLDSRGKNGLFMIGKKESVYYIITTNIIATTNIKKVQEIIDKVNKSSKEELKEMYKKQLKEGKLSEKGGAGLGFIDIARKTGEKLEYLFLPINPAHSYFILKTEIDTLKLKLH